MVPNAPYEYETHQNMSLGSNGMDWGHSLRKIPTRLRGTNFYVNCRVRPFLNQVSYGPKCSQTVQNARKQEFKVEWGGSGAFVAKNSDMPSWNELLH